MRRAGFLDNFKSFLTSNPPGVIFLACIFSFIVVISSFMGYIDRNKIRNPDELDWNAFRRKMAELDYCFKFPTKLTSSDKSQDYFVIDKSKKSYSYPVIFNMHFNGNKSELDSLSFYSGRIDGFLIGIDKEKFDVNFQIGETSLLYDEECTKNLLLGKECFKYTVKGCLTFTGFSKLFKKTKSPNLCDKSFTKLEVPKLDETSTSSFSAYKGTPELSDQYWCPSTYGTKAKINYKVDTSLIPFLNSADKELIQKNLKTCFFGLSITFTCLILVTMLKSVRKNNSYSLQENEL